MQFSGCARVITFFVFLVVDVDPYVLAIFIDADQGQHIARAHLEATAATDALFRVDRADELRLDSVEI